MKLADTIRVEVHCWPLVATPEDLAALSCELDEAETARARRFATTELGNEFVIARGQLRRLLGRLVGEPARNLRFVYGANGKPELADGPHFNLSHSGGLAAVAICTAMPVGLDIERIRPVEAGLQDYTFSPAECRQLDLQPDESRLREFFRYWTRKEAVLKAAGCGLDRDPRSFTIIGQRGQPAQFTVERFEASAEADTRWSIFDFTPAACHGGAIALPCGSAAVSFDVGAIPERSR